MRRQSLGKWSLAMFNLVDWGMLLLALLLLSAAGMAFRGRKVR